MELKPSLICFSQDSINNVFDKRSYHSGKSIGETLDDLCEGRCCITDIPQITVVKEDGQWITADNRRLWVFRHLERLGKCDTIPVLKGYFIPPAKRTSYNGGKSITVRRNPGGRWYLKPSVRVQSADQSVSSRLRDERYNNLGLFRPQSGLLQGSSNSATRLTHSYTRDTQAVSGNTAIVNDHVHSPAYPRFDHVSSNGPLGTRVAKYSYGVGIAKSFIPGVDPEERKFCIEDRTLCYGYFDVTIQKGQQLEIGQIYGGMMYKRSGLRPISRVSIYRSDQQNPRFVDDGSCELRGHVEIDWSEIEHIENRRYKVNMAYDGAELVVTVRILKTGKVYRKNIH